MFHLCGRYPVNERFPLSSASSFAFIHPGQCNGFQLILSHNMTYKSDLPANNHLQEIPWRVGSARPTLPNIALNALYVACLLWLTEHRNTVTDVRYTVRAYVDVPFFAGRWFHPLEWYSVGNTELKPILSNWEFVRFRGLRVRTHIFFSTRTWTPNFALDRRYWTGGDFLYSLYIRSKRLT